MRIKRKTVGRRIFLLSFQSVDKVVAGNGMFPALFFDLEGRRADGSGRVNTKTYTHRCMERRGRQ